MKWLKLIFLRYYRDMGLRVFLYALLSLVATLVSPLASPLLGAALEARIDYSSVLPVLTILATSMLAVSTFSLNIMVSAHRAAAGATTPRVHRLLLENTTTQSVLAAFIGAFVYSLGSIVLYRTGFYPEESAIVTMAITTLVVVGVVISLLRWIQHLTKLGSVEDSLQTAVERAREVLLAYARHPRFGANDRTSGTVLPTSLTALYSQHSGYLQLIDMALLERRLHSPSAIYLDVRPGSHVLEGDVIARVSGEIDDDDERSLLDAFTFGDRRTHEQDAEFGLTVLAEIASKALSPGVNDPGTAIQTVLALKTLLWEFSCARPDPAASTAPKVFAAFPHPSDLVEAAFAPIARDGGASIEVALNLRFALAALSRSKDEKMADAARTQAAIALRYAEAADLLAHEVEELNKVVL